MPIGAHFTPSRAHRMGAILPGFAWATGPLVLVFCAHIVMAGENVVVKATTNTRTIPLYDVFEISFQHEGKYANPFFDVTVDVTFTAPSGRKIPVGGFHYGSSAGPEILVRTNQDARGPRRQTEYHFARQDLWKARLAPDETGRWTYAFVFTNTSGGRASGSGSLAQAHSRALGLERNPLAIPGAALGLSVLPATRIFKWADNIQQTGDWSDFTLNGDAAPNDRFNYRAKLER